MDSISPAKKRKSASEPPRPSNDDLGTTLANLSLADLHRLIDQRVKDALEAVETKTLTLQRENEELLLRCESLERSVRVLKKEGHWTYSAPDVPISHWIEQGHDEDYAEEAGKLIQSINVKTNGLRSGDGDDGLIFGSRFLIRSDNALDPHWEQLASAVQLSERITTVNFSDVQLDQRNLQIIEASLRQKGIVEFYLDGNRFRGREGVQFAIDVLKSNRSVRCFGWEYNVFGSTEDACKLVDAVLGHSTINELTLARTLNEAIVPYMPVRRLFGGVGTDTLLEVNLAGNGIKSNGDRCIAEFLSTNPQLRSLYLEGNQLNDQDALHIGLALQSNTNLTYLDLDDNMLTENGKFAVHYHAFFGVSRPDILRMNANTVEINSVEINLNTVSDANHTCEIGGIDLPYLAWAMNLPKSAKRNRRRKLFLLLLHRLLDDCTINHLESEFSEDGMGLVPHVLACINTYATGYQAKFNLSLLFELARDWKTPEMYQFHHSSSIQS